MHINIAKDKITAALEKLKIQDAFLLENDVSERAITHKLAIYISEQFHEYDVDCEYNSNVQNDRGKKYIYLLKEKIKELNLLRDSDGDDEQICRFVYPDIIVHKRGLNESNLLIVEVKKTSSQVTSQYDHEKLARYPHLSMKMN